MILNPYAIVIDVYATLGGKQPGATSYADHKAYINANGQAAYLTALEGMFATQTNATMSATMLANLGLASIFTAAQGEAYLAANAGNRVKAALDLASALTNWVSDPTNTNDTAILAAKTTYVATTANAYTYASNSANISDSATSAAAVSTGQTFTLTTGVDNISGTTGDDTISASNTDFTTGDTIALSAGTDTLNIVMSAVGGPIATLSGVETVNVHAGVASNTSGPINTTNWTGLEALTLKGLGVTLTAANKTNAGWNFTNLQQNTALGLSNTKTADTQAAAYFGFGDNKVGSTTATLSLNLNGAAGTTATTGVTDLIVDTGGTDKFTKLAVNSTGANVVELNGNDASEISLTEITVTGAGSTNLSVDATNAVITSLATVNASAATGAFTSDISASTKDVTFTGSAGKNTITFGNGHNNITGGASNDQFTVGSGNNTVTGGDGNDTVITAVASLTKLDSINLGDGARDEIRYSDVTTLNSTGVNATALAALNAQTGVEVVGSSGAVTAIDASYFTQSVFNLTGALVAAVTGSNIAGDTIAFTSGITTVNGDALTVSGALPNQSLTLELGGAASVKLEGTDVTSTNTALTVSSGIATVNIVSSTTATSGTITNELSLVGATIATHAVDNVSAGSFVLTGSTNFTIDTGATAGFTNAVDFDATAFTGKLNIVGSASADVIKGGSGVDTIDGEDGADVLTGGAGADTFVFVTLETGNAAPTASNFETITDYEKGTDIIDWGSSLTIQAAAAAAVATVAQVSALGIATFHAEDDTLAERLVAATKGMDTDGDFVVFEHGTHTYVYISGDTNATQDADDTLIKLAGVTDVTSAAVNASNNIVLS